MTNADKYFRHATDEELSEILVSIDFQCANCPANSYCYDKYGDIVVDRTVTCKDVICDWLKQEVPAPPPPPLCLSCAHANMSVTDDFADCLCAKSGGYEGGKTKCKDYERR